MSLFVENSTHFAADCVCHDGLCEIARSNFHFLDHGQEIAAVDHLQRKCGNVVIMPDAAGSGTALLYHTSCRRMDDAVRQIFADCLTEAVSLPQAASEMSVGQMHRRCVGISYDDCRARVDNFSF